MAVSSISQLAKELDISMENLLAGIAREEICALLYLTDPGKSLFLMAPEDLGIDSYKKKANRSLRLAYCPGVGASKPKKTVILDVSRMISGENGEDSILAMPLNNGKISLEVHLEKMRIPMKIEIFDMSNRDIKPIEKRVTLIRSKEECTYLLYPTEADVATGILEIIRKLELIEDMSVYEKLFYDITHVPMEGKRVWMHLKEGFSGAGMEVSKEITEEIQSYANDPYMRKKWDNYKKRHNLEYYDWKTIITAICIFMAPICESIAESRPFIGDWMPELGRFL